MSNEIPEAILNPLLSKLRMPGATYRLPSQGLFYHNGELDETVINGEVEVYPMVAMDEIVIATPDKLFSGKAIEEVFSRCIPQIKKPNQLLAKDVDFLMVCLRLVSFGPSYEVVHKHTCENAKEHKHTIDLQQMIRNTPAVDPTTLYTEYKHTLSNGQVVSFIPISQMDLVNLYQLPAFTKPLENVTEEEQLQMMSTSLSYVISNVDGITDKEFIREWILKMRALERYELINASNGQSQWGTIFEVPVVCPDCNEEVQIQVLPNPLSFFI